MRIVGHAGENAAGLFCPRRSVGLNLAALLILEAMDRAVFWIGVGLGSRWCGLGFRGGLRRWLRNRFRFRLRLLDLLLCGPEVVHRLKPAETSISLFL
jgi:hypothetical protein